MFLDLHACLGVRHWALDGGDGEGLWRSRFGLVTMLRHKIFLTGEFLN